MPALIYYKEEKDFISKHMPGSITNECEQNFLNNLPVNFLSELYGTMDAYNLHLSITPFDIESIFPDREISSPENYSSPLFFISEENLEELQLDNFISNFGRDAFGLYLPFHYYDECWGIYLFKELIANRVQFLHSIFKSKISYEELRVFYYYAVYRHQLFHYQVERLATKIELITKNATYKPSRILFEKVKKREDWLEEALAESSVLFSKLVPRRTGLSAKLLKEIYKRDLQDMPPGHKDYHCKKYGGPVKAHEIFASQIIENSLQPKAIVPKLVSVKNEFSTLDKNVPTYLVTGFKKLERLHL